MNCKSLLTFQYHNDIIKISEEIQEYPYSKETVMKAKNGMVTNTVPHPDDRGFRGDRAGVSSWTKRISAAGDALVAGYSIPCLLDSFMGLKN
jgi:hypothetical protein